MKFCEIASFLNISEEVARSLGKQEILPGGPCSDGWETTSDEITRWYAKLSGKEWAMLATDGYVVPFIAEVDLESKVSTDALLTLLSSWEQKGIVKIVSQNLGSRANPEVVLTLREMAQEGREGIESLKQTSLIEPVRSQIQLVYRCKAIIGKNPIHVTISEKNILKVSIKDTMMELPQREREIIQHHLVVYAFRLSAELKAKHTNNTENR